MKNKFTVWVVSALTALLWLLPLQAQEEEGGDIARMVLITAKDGHEDSLVKGITDYHHWIANFEGHQEYTWYRIVTGPNSGKFIARTGGHNWADFDAEYDWQEEAGNVFESNVAPHIENMQSQFTEEMTEFSHWPESFDGYTHFSITDWHVKNGHYSKFRRGLKQIVDTLKAGGFKNHWGFFSVESGGYGNQIRIASANRGWSDMADEEPSFAKLMSESLGGQEEFDAFMSDWSSTFTTGLNQTIVRMPDASDYGKD